MDLMDVVELAKYMIAYDVGVNTEYNIPVKKLDVDYLAD
jgi:restriction endonuclease Mrr